VRDGVGSDRPAGSLKWGLRQNTACSRCGNPHRRETAAPQNSEGIPALSVSMLACRPAALWSSTFGLRCGARRSTAPPIRDLASDETAAFEALVRWNRGERGLIQPAQSFRSLKDRPDRAAWRPNRCCSRMVATAEGVETAEQPALSRYEGCTQAQGYLLSKLRPLTKWSDCRPSRAPARLPDPSKLPANKIR
jgi:hypothetical protein